jgi:hypothetical protein
MKTGLENFFQKLFGLNVPLRFPEVDWQYENSNFHKHAKQRKEER